MIKLIYSDGSKAEFKGDNLTTNTEGVTFDHPEISGAKLFTPFVKLSRVEFSMDVTEAQRVASQKQSDLNDFRAKRVGRLTIK